MQKNEKFFADFCKVLWIAEKGTNLRAWKKCRNQKNRKNCRRKKQNPASRADSQAMRVM